MNSTNQAAMDGIDGDRLVALSLNCGPVPEEVQEFRSMMHNYNLRHEMVVDQGNFRQNLAALRANAQGITVSRDGSGIHLCWSLFVCWKEVGRRKNVFRELRRKQAMRRSSIKRQALSSDKVGPGQ